VANLLADDDGVTARQMLRTARSGRKPAPWFRPATSSASGYIRHRPHDDLRRRRARVRHGRASGQQAGHGRSFRQSRASLATTKVTPARASAATQMMTTRAAPMLAPMTSQMMNTTWRARTVHAKMWRFLRGRGGPLVSAPLYVIVETVGERQRRGRGTRLTMYADSYKMSQTVRICRAAPDELAEVRWLSLAEAHELLPSMFGRARVRLTGRSAYVSAYLRT
jgi:hypothetical protein